MNTRTVKKHFLDFEKALSYFTEHLKNGNTLSISILNKIDFYSGTFFTLLPFDAALDRMYEFKWGRMISPVPTGMTAYDNPSYPEGYQIMRVITTCNELQEFTKLYLDASMFRHAILEEVMLNTDDSSSDLENVQILNYNKEIYYLLSKENSSDEIYDTLKQADCLWHFVMVLSEQKENIPSMLTHVDINQFCTNANFIIIRAYDGESFIFWEKNQ